MEEGLIKKLMASIKCDSCGRPYEARNVRVLGHGDGLWFLRVLCSSCHTRCLVAAIIKEDKVPEAVSDLTEAELGKFAVVDVIGADDMLNMHKFLKDFDGDFSRLFR